MKEIFFILLRFFKLDVLLVRVLKKLLAGLTKKHKQELSPPPHSATDTSPIIAQTA